MEKYILAIVLLSGCFFTVCAQNFFLIDTTHHLVNDFIDIDRRVVDLNTCAISTTTSEIPDAGYPLSPPDMTIAGGTPNSFFLSRGNFDSAPDDLIGHSPLPIWGPNFLMGIPYAPETLPMGIASDYNRNVYMVGEQGVSFIDGASLEADYIDDLPPAFRPLGQMTFREGSFYYPSVGHELIQLKIDENHNYYIRSVGSLPDTLLYGGLFSIPETCENGITYLIHRAPESGGTIYELDITDASLTEHCLISYKAISAAYNGENTLPICDNYLLDLATDNDTELNRYDSLCSGTILLLDDNISLTPELEFDSITVNIQNPLDAADEWLSISTMHPEVLITGNNTGQLTLASTGFTRASPLMGVLASLTYTNEALMPTSGQRIIEVSAHHPFHGVVSASVFVEIVSGTLTISTNIVEPSCYGNSDGSIELEVSGTASYNLSWENGDSVLIRDDLTTGIYVYQIMDSDGCSYGDSLLVDQPDSLSVNITSPQDSICGSNGSLTAVALGGTLPYAYDWNTDSDQPEIESLSSGTYSITITDANGCEDNNSYTLYERETIVEEIRAFSCQGDAVQINGQDYTVDTTFQEMLTSTEGCDSLLDVQLTFFDTFYSFSAYELCPGESISIGSQVFMQDTSFSLTLQTQEGCDSTEHYAVSFSTPIVTPLSAGICEGENYNFAGALLESTGIYYDTLVANSGCDSLVELNLQVNSLPVIEIEQQGSLCNGDEILFSVEENFTDILWSTGSQSSNLIITTIGNYSLTVTDDNGCTNSEVFSVADDPPTVEYVVNNPSCPDGQGQLELVMISGGQPPYQIEQTGDVVTSGDLIVDLNIGNYNYNLQDASGCTTPLVFEIFSENDLIVDLPAELSIKLGESIEIPAFTASPLSQINWSPPEGLECTDCLVPIAKPTESTRYFLNIEDENGCQWEGSIFIKVAIPDIYIPNVFSPNNDGSNDTFAPALNNAVESITSFSIYDRWGAQVFQSSSSLPSWDGFIGGQLAGQGVYVYFLEWVDKAGNRRLETGEVLLLY